MPEGRDKTVARVASTLLSGVTLGIAPLVCRRLWQGSDAAKEIRKAAIRARIQAAPRPLPPYPRDPGEPYVKILGSEAKGGLFLGSIHGLALASHSKLRDSLNRDIVPSHNPQRLTHIISLCPIEQMKVAPFLDLKGANRREIVSFLHFPKSIQLHPVGEIIQDQGARGDLISTLLTYTSSLDARHKFNAPPFKGVQPLTDILKTNPSLKKWCELTFNQWKKSRPFFGSHPESFETHFYQHLPEIEEEAIQAFQHKFDHSGWALLVHACSSTLPVGIPVQEVRFNEDVIAEAQRTLLTTPVTEWFEPAFQILDEAVFGNSRVFVHCQAGRSRSPAFLAAYLINRFDVTADEALNFLAHKRPQVNSRFLYELRDYAAKLKTARAESWD